MPIAAAIGTKLAVGMVGASVVGDAISMIASAAASLTIRASGREVT